MSAKTGKIAVINLTRMGDLLMTGPLLDSLREQHPDHEIHLIATTGYMNVAAGMGWDQVIPFDFNVLTTLSVEAAKNSDRIPLLPIMRDFKKMLAPLLTIPYDAIYNVSHTDVSSVLSWLMNGPVKGGVTLDARGYRSIPNIWARYFFAGNLNRHLNPFHLVDVMVGTGDGVGSRTRRSEMRYTVPPEAESSFRQMESELGLDNEKGPRIVIQCGASENNKRWEPEKFGKVGRKLRDATGAHILYVGTESELPFIRTASQATGEGAYILAGKTDIPTLAAWLQSSDLLISNDTGTMHLAQSVGTKSLVITLASALSDETGPYGEGNLIVEPNVSCFPCSFHVVCPHLDCHSAITVPDISRLALNMLQGKVKNRYEQGDLSQGLVLWQSGFDQDGWWKKQPLTQLPITRDRVAREIFRELWKARFEPELRPNGYHATHLAAYLKASFGSCPAEIERRFREKDIPVVRAIAEHARVGQGLAAELQELVSEPEKQYQRIQHVGKSLANLDHKLEEMLITNELWRPLMLLFHFEAGNLTHGDLKKQTEETEYIYQHLEMNADSVANLLEEVLTHWDNVSETHSGNGKSLLEHEKPFVVKSLNGKQRQDNGFSALQRPRMRGDRLHILFPRETYFIQQEMIDAFRRLGHKVTELRYNDNPNFIHELLHASLDADLLVTINHLSFDKYGELANLLAKIGLPYVSWFVDRPGFILLDHETGPNDLAFLKTWERSTIHEIESYGFTDVEFLPLATDPERFYPGVDEGTGKLRWVANSMLRPAEEWRIKAGIPVAPEKLYEKAIDIQISGRIEGLAALEIAANTIGDNISGWNAGKRLTWASAVALGSTLRARRQIAKECTGLDLVLYGDEGWKALTPKTAYNGPVPYPDGLPGIYRGGIHLNVTSYQMPTGVNQRVFDIPAAGGILLTDDQEDLGDLFDHDRECLTFDHPEEAANKAAYLLQHQDYGRKISARARERILKEHTYDRRAQNIISTVRKRVGRPLVSLQGGEAC